MRIENAQSASSSSLITAPEGGVLNERRCKKYLGCFCAVLNVRGCKNEIKFKQEWMDFYKSKTNNVDDKIIYPNRLGKFHDKPSVGGQYYWMDNNYFQANYVDDVIIFEEIKE